MTSQQSTSKQRNFSLSADVQFWKAKQNIYQMEIGEEFDAWDELDTIDEKELNHLFDFAEDLQPGSPRKETGIR